MQEEQQFHTLTIKLNGETIFDVPLTPYEYKEKVKAVHIALGHYWWDQKDSPSVLDIADQFQKDCHNTVDKIIKLSTKDITVQDATNIWMFHKLAELEKRTEELSRSSK